MLSRVADNLYWMSRFVERAESISRMVEVTKDTYLESRREIKDEDFWHSTLNALCAVEVFEGDPIDKVDEFLLFSKDWMNSTRNCIFSARENARMVRDQLSDEIWIELNNLYLFFHDEDALLVFRNRPSQFFARVIRFSLVFQGLVEATVHHDEGWRFISIGKYLERADQTSRILDTLTLKFGESSRTDLISVLRSSSALSAYRRQFRGELSLRNVASFLLFSQDFPRSIRFAIRRIDSNLHEISGVPRGNFSNEAERLIGSVLAMVNFTDIDTLMNGGLHQSIDDLQNKLIDVGQRIFEAYVLLPFENENLSQHRAVQSFAQQQ